MKSGRMSITDLNLYQPKIDEIARFHLPIMADEKNMIQAFSSPICKRVKALIRTPQTYFTMIVRYCRLR